MRIGSLFSGYGGLDMGVQAVLGGDVVWHSDICKVTKAGVGHYDPHRGACRLLEHRFPGVPNLGDISTVDWSQVEPVDVLTGGFPCQDVSAAGKRAGIRPGTRSGLWTQFAYAISQLRPSLVVIENVRGLLSAKAHSDVEPCPWCVGDDTDGALRALGAVLGDLADLGYDASWRGIRAADVGAPHGRFRVFVVAYPQGDAGRVGDGDGGAPADAASSERPDRAGCDDARRPLVGAWIESGSRADAGDSSEGVRVVGRSSGLLPTPRSSDANGAGAHGDGGLDLRTAVGLLPTPTTRDHKGRNQRDDATCLTGALLPTPRAGDGTKGGPNQRGSSGDLMLPSAVALLPTPSVADGEGGHERRGGARGDELLLNGVAKEMARLLPTPRVKNNENRQSEGYGGEDGNFHGLMHNPERWGDYAPAIARWEALTRPAPAPTMTSSKGNPQLAPAFVEWMMGLPAGWVTDVPGLTRNDMLKLCGNGVVPQQAEAALGLLLSRQVVAA